MKGRSNLVFKMSAPLFFGRFLSLFIALALILPHSAFALRKQQTADSGLEEQQITEALLERPESGPPNRATALQPAAGLEEKWIQDVGKILQGYDEYVLRNRLTGKVPTLDKVRTALSLKDPVAVGIAIEDVGDGLSHGRDPAFLSLPLAALKVTLSMAVECLPKDARWQTIVMGFIRRYQRLEKDAESAMGLKLIHQAVRQQALSAIKELADEKNLERRTAIAQQNQADSERLREQLDSPERLGKGKTSWPSLESVQKAFATKGPSIVERSLRDLEKALGENEQALRQELGDSRASYVLDTARSELQSIFPFLPGSPENIRQRIESTRKAVTDYQKWLAILQGYQGVPDLREAARLLSADRPDLDALGRELSTAHHQLGDWYSRAAEAFEQERAKVPPPKTGWRGVIQRTIGGGG